MTERIPAIQEGLAAAVTALDDLATKVSIDEVTLRRVKRSTTIATIGVIADIALTVLMGWGLVGVNNNQARVNQLQAAVQQEADQSRTAQCAMVALFLQFEPKTLANPAYTEEQHALQVQAYATLKQIAKDLECR